MLFRSDAAYITQSDKHSRHGWSLHFQYADGSLSAAFAWKAFVKQGPVAQSTAEAEYIAAGSAVGAVQSVLGLLDELGLRHAESPIMRIDNTSTINQIQSGVHSLERHVDLKYRKLHRLHREGAVTLEHVSGEDEIADILTKTLPVPAFRKLRNGLFGYPFDYEYRLPADPTIAARLSAVSSGVPLFSV